MKTGAIQVRDLDDPTMLEVVSIAAKAGVAIVERAGKMAACSAQHIPPGWHRVGAVEKPVARQ